MTGNVYDYSSDIGKCIIRTTHYSEGWYAGCDVNIKNEGWMHVPEEPTLLLAQPFESENAAICYRIDDIERYCIWFGTTDSKIYNFLHQLKQKHL